MNPNTLFYILIAFIIIDFVVDKIIDHLNAKHFDDKVPEELADVYDEKEYLKSQAYKKENYKFSIYISTFSIVVTLAFFLV